MIRKPITKIFKFKKGYTTDWDEAIIHFLEEKITPEDDGNFYGEVIQDLEVKIIITPKVRNG